MTSAIAGAFILTGLDRNTVFPWDPREHILFLSGALALFVIVCVICRSCRRKKALERLALSAGLAFDTDAARLPYLENSGIDTFNLGYSRKSENLLISSGAGAAKVYFFDYSAVTGAGKNPATHKYTLAFFEFSESIFPRFALRPQGFTDKAGEMIGFQNIDMDGSPVFSKEYKLNGPDKAAVRAFFNSRTVNYFEQNPGWRVQAAGQRIIAFKKDALVPVAGYRSWMEEAKNLVSAITAAGNKP